MFLSGNKFVLIFIICLIYIVVGDPNRVGEGSDRGAIGRFNAATIMLLSKATI